MKRMLKAGAAGLLIGLVVAVAVLWTPDTDPDAMRTKYGGQKDRYAPAAEGMDVHYRVSGPEGGPVLVMIHGTSASLHTWEPLRQRLEDRYRIIAYDQPGHGLTGPHPDRDYTYRGMADGLDAVFAAEGIDEAVLIGNSMGGWVAWRDALANPHRVRALVLIDASGIPRTEKPKSALGFRIMASPIGRLIATKITPRAIIKASVEDTIARDEVITEEMIDRYWELLRYPGNRGAMADQFATERQDLSARLPEITAPSLILWGAEDQLIPAGDASEFERRMPNARAIVYDGVGHIPMEEVPDEVARDIGAFLEEVL